jgi:hypothetical protein
MSRGGGIEEIIRMKEYHEEIVLFLAAFMDTL